jgi:hypothetical protein
MSLDCHQVDDHEAWAAAQGRPVMYPRWAFHVERRCLCRGTGRYYAVNCAGIAGHGVWADQDWYSGEESIFVEQHQRAAWAYRKAYMAGVGRSPG